MVDLCCWFATLKDVAALALLNAQLIRDEGHCNRMSVSELEQRMSAWLSAEYKAVLFEFGSEVVGYALFRQDREYVYLRQLFVTPSHRRRGVGRAALTWLWSNAWPSAARLRIDVLLSNTAAQSFWHAVGFKDYCVVMEMERPNNAS